MPEKPKDKILKPKLESEREFGWNAKKFYGVPLSEKSEMSHDRQKFFRPDSAKPAPKELSTKEAIEKYNELKANHRKTTTDLHVDQTKQHFKKDAAHFYAETYKTSDVGSSRGSIFQDNAAEFYGVPKPEHGEKPFRINKKNLKDPSNVPKTSVLNERRLKNHEMNMQRHPMYGKNLRRFWGLKSQSKYYPSNVFIGTNSVAPQLANSRAISAHCGYRKPTYAEQLTNFSKQC